MVGPVIDVSPKTSSRYQLPDFSPIAQSGMFMGQQFSQGLNKLGDQMRKRKQKAKIGSLFEQHGDDWSAINQALFADPSIRMDDNFWKIMGHSTGRQDAAQAQSNTDRNYGLSAERVQLERERANMSREEFEFRKGQIARQEAAAAEAAANAVHKSNVQNFINPTSGEMRALDLNTHEGVAAMNEMLASGWIEGEATGSDRSGLTTGATTEAQKKMAELENSMTTLGSIKETMSPEMLTTINKFAGGALKQAEKHGLPLTDEQQAAVYARELWSANVYRYQNNMLNMLSGAAVSEPEQKRIEQQLPTVNDSYSEFIAKYDAAAASAEAEINKEQRKLYGDAWQDIKMPRFNEGGAKTDDIMSSGQALGQVATDTLGAVVPAANAGQPTGDMIDFSLMSDEDLLNIDVRTAPIEEVRALEKELERREKKNKEDKKANRQSRGTFDFLWGSP